VRASAKTAALIAKTAINMSSMRQFELQRHNKNDEKQHIHSYA